MSRDFFLNLANWDLYGPKNSSGWGAVNLKGVTGAQGIPGSAILFGQTAPISSMGKNCDFYINLKDMTICGPKSNSVWGELVSLDKNVEATFYREQADFSFYNYVNQDSSFAGTSKPYTVPNALRKFIEVYYLSTGRLESADITKSWNRIGSSKTVVNYNIFEQLLNNVYLSADIFESGDVQFRIIGKGFAIKPDFSRPGGYLTFLAKVTDVKSIETLSKVHPDDLRDNQDIITLK